MLAASRLSRLVLNSLKLPADAKLSQPLNFVKANESVGRYLEGQIASDFVTRSQN